MPCFDYVVGKHFDAQGRLICLLCKTQTGNSAHGKPHPCATCAVLDWKKRNPGAVIASTTNCVNQQSTSRECPKTMPSAERIACLARVAQAKADAQAAKKAAKGTKPAKPAPPTRDKSTLNPPTTFEQQTTNYLGVISQVLDSVAGKQRETDFRVQSLTDKKSTGLSLTNPDGGPNFIALGLLGALVYFGWRWLK
jgi:hypothetical protein